MKKGARIYNGEKTVPSISGAGKSGQPHVKKKKKVKLACSLTPYTKMD